MVLDYLKNALAGDGAARGREILDELERIRDALAERQKELDAKQGSRLQSLFPQGPVDGFQNGYYPGLDPLNFMTDEPGWLIAVATGIIDKFPGSETLLSQLDATFLAFSDANHYRVVPGGPHAIFLDWQRELLVTWDLTLEIPIYIANGGGSKVLGCSTPFAILDYAELKDLHTEEQHYLLATLMGHVFFGNLRIFAFFRLMEMLDKLPNMSSLITRGLGMIPGIGNTISRGLELAKSLNNQVIRKTNLVVGQRQHVLRDRLASLPPLDPEVPHRYLSKRVLGSYSEKTSRCLIEQGREISRRFQEGKVNLSMFSIVGPMAEFGAYRAFRLSEWHGGERAKRIAGGYYVTRQRLKEYRKANVRMEEEIKGLEKQLIALHEKEIRLEEELRQLASREKGEPDSP